MKKQRPTIAISDWKLATHLQSTREIQNQKDTPAYNCRCEWCLRWKSCYKKLFPDVLQQQLLRVGIQLENPTDLYQFGSLENGASIRVVYHLVGKILSGPDPWVKNDTGEIRMRYQIIRKEPYLGLVVFPQSQSIDPSSPVLVDKTNGDLIRIDFRLSFSQN